MEEEQLDHLIATEAMRKGWAENKALLVVRILKIFLKDAKTDKETRDHMRFVIRYLEGYKFDD